MTAAEFLQHIWPASGVFCLATPFQAPGMVRPTFAHKTFTSIAAAAAYVEQARHSLDLYCAIHTLREARVWNPNKTDKRTGTKGSYEVRTHANMAESRAFFLDLDVGEGPQKYASQAEAVRDLQRFCRLTGLPKPTLVSSGGGIHVYWVLTDAYASSLWVTDAAKLKALTLAYQLKADPSRTSDPSSVLRVAGTFNWKHRANPRAVRVLQQGVGPCGTQAFLDTLDDAFVVSGASLGKAPAILPDAPSSDALGSNLTDTFDGPPVSMRALVTACAQVRHVAATRGNVSEPAWYHTLNLVRFVERGDEMVHRISEGHPDYDAAITDAKVEQLRSRGVGPTSCAKLAEVCGAERCTGCAFFERVKSPLVAARFKDPAPAPTVLHTLGLQQVSVTIPSPPEPYTRLKTGSVAFVGKNRDGDDMTTVIYQHDLYPTRRLVNPLAGTEQHGWRVHLPREGVKDFLLDADALYDRRKFASTIANHGVLPGSAMVPYLQDYMIAYIAELQKQADAEAQHTHLGWSEDHAQFILPDKVLLADGTAKPSTLSMGAQRASAYLRKKGDASRQVQLLHFYQHPAYLPNQFFILGSLAAPLFYMTGHHGVILNASGEAGSSKSTSLYTAASFWGQPELYPINGTASGATMRGRNERVTTLANLPVCVDEITHLPVKDAIDLAMGISQPGHRIRLASDGMERAAPDSHKATIMLTTANNSLHTLLSVDNAAGTAGSMRVVELQFRANLVHQKPEADAFGYELRQHFGHLGEVFMHHVVQHRLAIEARVREVMADIDRAAHIQSSERFWSATIAAVLVAAEVAQTLGILPFDPLALRTWALDVQIPFMRGVVIDEYASPMAVLAEYLEHANAGVIVVGKLAGSSTNLSHVIKSPQGQLLAHYDVEEQTMWILKKGFKDYCLRTGANMTKIIHELAQPKLDAAGRTQRIITSSRTRKVLGAGTEYAKAQSWCFALNMTHPDVSGAVTLELAGSATTAPVLRRIG